MVDVKLSDLQPADALTDADLFYVVQGGNSRQTNGAAVKAYAGGGGSGRTLLTADTTYNVPATYATIQDALQFLESSIDFAGHQVIIQVADSGDPYAQDVTVPVMVGQANIDDLLIQGNTTTPANVILSSTNFCFSVSAGARCKVAGFQFGGGKDSIVANPGGIIEFESVDFNSATHGFVTSFGGTLQQTSDCTCSGHAPAFYSSLSGLIKIKGTLVLTGTINFNNAFADIEINSTLDVSQAHYDVSGATVTGARYYILGGLINTGGQGSTFLPGDTDGTVDTGAYGAYV